MGEFVLIQMVVESVNQLMVSFSSSGRTNASSSASGRDCGSSESAASRSRSSSENHTGATSEESDAEKGKDAAKRTVLNVANTFSDDSDGGDDDDDDDDSKVTRKSRTAAIRDIIRVCFPKLSAKFVKFVATACFGDVGSSA